MNFKRLHVVELSLLVAVLLAGAVRADDRDFVRKSVEDPYVFILFDVSGRTWPCATSNETRGCSSGANQNATPAVLTDAYALQRVQRLPKLGDTNDTPVTFYIQKVANGTMYEVTYANNGTALPADPL